MNKKKKIILSAIAVSLMLCMIISASYAYYLVNEGGTHNITAAVEIPNCASVSLTGGTTLNLTGDLSAPISDVKALGSENYRYEFTVANGCQQTANIKIAIAPNEDNTMPIGTIKYALIEQDANIPSSGNYLVDAQATHIDERIKEEVYALSSAEISIGYQLLNLTLQANTSKSYYLYLWIDYYEGDKDQTGAFSNTTMNKSFNGHLVVSDYETFGTTAELTAFAVYSADDNSLTIYKNHDVVTNGRTYHGKEATAVYTGFEEETLGGQPRWSVYRETITSVTVADIIKPKIMTYWFYNFKNAHTFDVTNIDTSNVTDMYETFCYAGYSVTDNWSIGDLSGWDVSKVTNMRDMFYYAGYSATGSWTVGDLSGWDVSNVTNMSSMFARAGYSATDSWSIGDLSGWDVSSVTDMPSMFANAGYSADNWSIGDLSNWDVSNVTNMSNMFASAGYSVTDNWSIGDLSNWDVSNVTDISSLFNGVGHSAYNWSIGDLSNWDVSSVTDMALMFTSAGYSVTDNWSIGDLSNWDVSNVTDMSYMFYFAGYSATDNWSIGDLSNWDVSNVTSLSDMFYNAGHSATDSWSIGDLSGWDVSNVTDMSEMFYNAGEYVTNNWSIGDLSNWDVSNVTDMSYMFSSAGASATNNWSVGDLANWDVSKVTTMSQMFRDAGRSVTDNWSINLSNWDVSNVTNMSSMFEYAGSSVTGSWTVGDLSGWDVSNVTNMSYMFRSTPATTFDLSGWDVSNVTNMSYMFYECYNVATALARSQVDADKLNASIGKPSSWSFVSVATPITLTINNQASSLVTINIPNVIEANVTKFELKPIGSVTKIVSSFNLNGTRVEGNSFYSPSESGTVTISNVQITDVPQIVIESGHFNEYPKSSVITEEVYWPNATSLTVVLDYQTYNTSYDYIYIYDRNNTAINNKKYGGTTRTTETITVSGNYAKIYFKTDKYGTTSSYYGFKATITPNA